MGDRTRSLDDLGRRVLAEQFDHRRSVSAFREVWDRGYTDDSRDVAADGGMLARALKHVVALVARRQQSQKPPCRLASHHNRRRVDTETVTVSPHPANRRLHVLDLRRPWCLIHDAILARDADIPTRGQAHTITLFEGRAVRGLPAAPRQKEQTLDRTRSMGWTEDIDF